MIADDSTGDWSTRMTKWRGANIEPWQSLAMNDPGVILLSLAKQKVLCISENAGWRALTHPDQCRQ